MPDILNKTYIGQISMQNLRCDQCDQMTGHKRYIGAGTIILAVVTSGIALLAIPFYPILCMKCGADSGTSPDKIAEREKSKQRTINLVVGFLILSFVIGLFIR